MSPAAPPEEYHEAKTRSVFLRLSDLRFFTFSLFIHIIVVLVFGGVVLVEYVKEQPDFAASGGTLVAEDVGGAPEQTEVQVLNVPEPQVVTPQSPSMEVLTSAVVQTSFQLTKSNISASDGKMIGEMAAKLDVIGAGTGGGPGASSGMGKVGGTMKFMGMQAVASSVVFVVDVSSSMISGEKSLRTYNALEGEVVRVIKDLDERCTFGLVVFSQDARSYRDRLIRASREEKEKGINWLRKLNPDEAFDARADASDKAFHHGTRADRGLAEAFEMRPDVIFFVSDGEPSGATTEEILTQVLQKQKAMNKPAIINTFAYLADGGQRFMRELAEKNGGKFREINPKDVK